MRTLPGSPTGEVWSVDNAVHVYGLPEIKAHKKGTLTLGADELRFRSKEGETSIPRDTITAVSAGNERVELWGTTGRIMRMVIPDNGGMAIAAVAHHQIDMLTVEFHDARGGDHAATFFLSKNQASQAIEKFALGAKPVRSEPAACSGLETDPQSILIAAPKWDGTEVPEAYQGLLYEHLVDRFQKEHEIKHVYRSGESAFGGKCPQYTLKLTVKAFKEGSSVKRAMFGPVGMFVGTTQMVFDAELVDKTGVVSFREDVKATVRGESESTNVADKVAKSIAKKYEAALKKSQKHKGDSSLS